LLKEKEIPYRYRDYRDEPLSATEIRAVLEKLGVGPVDVLRRKDAAFKKLGLTGKEPAASDAPPRFCSSSFDAGPTRNEAHRSTGLTCPKRTDSMRRKWLLGS